LGLELSDMAMEIDIDVFGSEGTDFWAWLENQYKKA
jgi:hypothetical protein